MIRFLDKKTEMPMLERLFDLLCENMEAIAPSGLSYEEEKRIWLSQVVPAMEKEPRQILLLTDGNGLMGYCQYYISSGILMVEEVQLRRDCRSSSAIVSLVRMLLKQAGKVTFLEAYADRRNRTSRSLLEKLGMECIGEDGQFLHYRVEMKIIRERFAGKRL